MAQVVWSAAALQDVAGIRAYLAQFNPNSAMHVAAQIIAAGNGLVSFPNRGRAIGKGRRELLLIWPYVIRYSVNADTVGIIRVRHGARRPEP